MRKRVLVIDDDEDILSILEIILEAEGYEPVLYNTGKSAEEIGEICPELILLDIRIAGFPKTGVEICTEYKAHQEIAGIPVLLISAEENIEAMAYGCGADGFVNKPFDIFGLIARAKALTT